MLRSSSRMRKNTGESVGSGWLLFCVNSEVEDESLEGHNCVQRSVTYVQPSTHSLQDKITAASDRATVLNDDIMESLFGCDLGGSGRKKRVGNRLRFLCLGMLDADVISSALLAASSQLSSKRWFARAIVRISSTMSMESSTRNHFKPAPNTACCCCGSADAALACIHQSSVMNIDNDISELSLVQQRLHGVPTNCQTHSPSNSHQGANMSLQSTALNPASTTSCDCLNINIKYASAIANAPSSSTSLRWTSCTTIRYYGKFINTAPTLQIQRQRCNTDEEEQARNRYSLESLLNRPQKRQLFKSVQATNGITGNVLRATKKLHKNPPHHNVETMVHNLSQTTGRSSMTEQQLRLSHASA
ncbi:hypothetical protein Tco_1228694 [Tanacetum coccineum]